MCEGESIFSVWSSTASTIAVPTLSQESSMENLIALSKENQAKIESLKEVQIYDQQYSLPMSCL